MCRFAWLALFCIWSLSDVVQAEKCIQDWACWEVRETGNRLEFWARNLKPHVFTASLQIRAKNLKKGSFVRSSYEAVEVIPGYEERLLITLYPTTSLDAASYRDIFYWTPGDMHAEPDDQILYVAPFAEGESYSLVQGFGGGWSHRGASKYAVDFAMPIGTAVHAAREGTVVQVVSNHSKGGSDRRFAKYANYIVILHADGTTGEYYHLMKDGAVVEVDQAAKAGDLIGYSGNTGFSSLPHLHFAVYRPQPMGDYESLPFEFEAGLATRRNWFLTGS